MERFPLVTIIMPIRNEAGFIERSLRAVLNQDYPRDRMEVFIADGMSDDGTREIIERVLERWRAGGEAIRIPVRIIDNPGRIVPTGLNAALREARGDIIIRVDGHCEIAPDYVRRCVEVMRETGADCVGGLQRAVGRERMAEAIALAMSSWFGVGNARFHYADKAGWADTVYLGAYHRGVFRRIGDFDEELIRNQDDEFNFRLIQAGGKIWLDPSIRSVYYSRSDLKGLWRQYFQYGFYKVRVMQKRRAVPAMRHLVPGAFVLAVGASGLVAGIMQQWVWGLSVIGPYAVCNLVASVWVGRRDWRVMPLLPVAFVILHVAYGVGFLWGLWRWRVEIGPGTGDGGPGD